jgi:HEAT repeat protein
MDKLQVLCLGIILTGCGRSETVYHDKTASEDKNQSLYQDKSFTVWLHTLQDSDPGVRQRAIYAVAKLGPAAREIVPVLIKAASTDRVWHVRAAALDALRNIDPGDKEVVLAFTEALKDPDPGIRMTAAQALKDSGREGKTAIPVLIEMMQNTDELCRIDAAWALWRIDHRAEVVLPVLLEALQDKGADIRHCAVAVLEEMGAEAKPAVPILTESLKDQEESVRKRFIQALRKIDKEAAAKAGIP